MDRRSFLHSAVTLPGMWGVTGPGMWGVTGGRTDHEEDGTATPREGTPTRAGTAVLGRIPLPGAKEAVVAPDGRTAYLATGDGFAVVDVSDPADPAVLFERRGSLPDRDDRLVDVYDVKFDAANDLLAVVGPANPGGGGDWFQGLLVYDVSEPAAPELRTVHETDHFNHNCEAAGGHVYLCANGAAGRGNALVIVDARTGEAVGRWSVTEREPGWQDVRPFNWILHEVHVHDDLAYLSCWDAGTWIVDVSEPSAPEFVAKLRGRGPEAVGGGTRSRARADGAQPPGNDHTTTTNEDGTLLALGVEAWDRTPDDGRGGPGGVTLYDVSDPTDPVEKGFVAAPATPDPTPDGVWTTAHNLDLRDGRLYSAWYRGGVRVHDVSDPAEPVEIAAWRDSYETSFWTAQVAPGEFFLAPSRRGRDENGEFTSDAAAVYTFGDPPPGAGPTTATGDGGDGGDGGSAADATETGTGVGATTGGAGQPGFGPLSVVAGLGAGAWYALRRRERE